MPEWISKLSEPIKAIVALLQSHFWGIAAFTAAFGWTLILLPNQIFVVLYIDSVRSTYLGVIGAVTFVSTFTVCFGVLYKGYGFLQAKRVDQEKSRRKGELLRSLTPTEYEYLHKFIARQSQTATFTVFDGVIAGLVEKGVVYMAGSQANKAGEQDFNLFSWAYDYLSAHPELFRAGAGYEKNAG